MFEQALQHYNAHLNIARDLKDIASEARALSNVGNYYSVRVLCIVCIYTMYSVYILCIVCIYYV